VWQKKQMPPFGQIAKPEHEGKLLNPGRRFYNKTIKALRLWRINETQKYGRQHLPGGPLTRYHWLNP